MNSLDLIAMSVLYIFAGLNHFRVPKVYLRIMPPYFPYPLFLVYVSGFFESLLGALLLWPLTRTCAAWGIIALLIAVFPANFYMYQKRKTTFSTLPAWGLAIRLPLQLVLVAWAYLYTR